MRTRTLLLLILFSGNVLMAQTFSEVPNTPFTDVSIGGVVFADVDGDDDQDVFVTGHVEPLVAAGNLFFNDGNGNFTPAADNPFAAVYYCDVAFADVDGDNDPDLFLTGKASGVAVSKLYLNDGNGNFSEVPDTPFPPTDEGSIDFADIDGDGDLDLFIMQVNSSPSQSGIYLNDGNGNFSESPDSNIQGLKAGTAHFVDVDGDDDPDLFVLGDVSFLNSEAKIYTNDGTGHFTEMVDTPFSGEWDPDADFADVDGDGDPDLFIMGGLHDQLAELFLNDGAGNFTLVDNTPMEGLRAGTVAFFDADQDGDPDLLQAGFSTLANNEVCRLYLNDGTGSFEEFPESQIIGHSLGTLDYADVDDDSDLDLIVIGKDTEGNRFAKLYLNEGIPVSSTNDTELSALHSPLFPNPAVTGQLYFGYTAETNTPLEISVVDHSGRRYLQQEVAPLMGEQIYSLNIADLPSGSYLLLLQNGKERIVQSFIVP